MAKAQTTDKTTNPMTVFRGDLARMEQQFAAALPPQMPVARFIRVVLTAVQNKPELLNADRQSLFNSCMKAAQDGLLPDGREGTITVYNEKVPNTNTKIKKAVWMPMVAGIRKKVRQSGELYDFYQHVVHQGDEFEYELGDHAFIKHKPADKGGRTRPVTHAYSVAIYKGPPGTPFDELPRSFEVMNVDEIEDVRRKYARAEGGPWSEPVAYPEMCRKTVARLHSKSLPMSTDVIGVINRDNELYQLEHQRADEHRALPQRDRTTTAAFDHFAGVDEGSPDATTVDASEGAGATDASSNQHTGGAASPTSSQSPTRGDAAPPPTDPESYLKFVETLVAKTREDGKDPLTLKPWLVSDQQRALRSTCHVDKETYDKALALIEAPK